MRKIALILAVFALASVAFAGDMTFEGLGTNQYIGTPYTENGVTISGGNVWISGPGYSSCGLGGCTNDGTNVAIIAPGTTVTAGGSPFTLNSFDYGQAFNQCCGDTVLYVTGNVDGGGTVSASFSLTGLGYQTANLNWGNLDSVQFSGNNSYWFGVDNIAVNNTPEPGSLILLGSGLVGMAGVIRRRLA